MIDELLQDNLLIALLMLGLIIVLLLCICFYLVVKYDLSDKLINILSSYKPW